MKILETKQVSKTFNGITAIKDLNLSVEAGDTHGIIGPNGAGKTTLFNVVSGIFPPSSGEVIFMNEVLNGLKPFQISMMGIARTFQNIRLFPHMTVLENVMVGRHVYNETNFWKIFLRPPFSKVPGEKSIVEKSKEFLDLVGLYDERQQLASNLSYGDQRRLEIARALATEPKLLLLDEPAAGMNPNETAELLELIEKIQGFGITILLIEHDMKLVMGISRTITVLNFGEKIGEGSPSEIQNNEKVIEAYLGSE